MTPGDFIWYEIVSYDTERVEEFYKNIIGWTPQTESSTGGDPYTLFLAGDEPVAGISPATPPEDARSHWFGYIYTENVDEIAGRAADLGGEVHRGPIEVAGLGRFYVLGDPSGTTFAMFSPDAPRDFEPQVDQGPGRFDWQELYAENIDETCEFYGTLFDWERGDLHEMKNGRYQIVVRDGEPIGGIAGLDDMEGDNLPAPHWNFYIRVRDVEQSAAAIEANDGTILNGPMDMPDGDRVVIFRDPTGAVASLVS